MINNKRSSNYNSNNNSSDIDSSILSYRSEREQEKKVQISKSRTKNEDKDENERIFDSKKTMQSISLTVGTIKINKRLLMINRFCARYRLEQRTLIKRDQKRIINRLTN